MLFGREPSARGTPSEAMPRILVLHAHPAPNKSQANRRLLDAARRVGGVTVRELYEEYPDFLIDVPREQRLMESHDVLVLQHPLFWYSAPALVKEWLDLVLQPGWAYGDGGRALHGKFWIQAVTCGGSLDFYCSAGRHGRTVRDFLLPFEQTARLCGMRFLAPFVMHGVGTMTDAVPMEAHAAEYARVLEALRDDGIDWEAAATGPWLNADLDAVLRSPTPSAS